jgi:hypothetical protein
MAVLIIDDVSSPTDLLDLARHLLDLLSSGTAAELVSPGTVHITRRPQPITDRALADLVALDEDYTCHSPIHRAGCSCRYDAAHTDPRQRILVDADRHDGPVPYVRCPRAGTHLRLTECWMCWSDVHRGAMSVESAVATA